VSLLLSQRGDEGVFQKAKSLIRAAAVHDVAFSRGDPKSKGPDWGPGLRAFPPRSISPIIVFPNCSACKAL
jgi:hypothetical protein